jgi:hypothetical protein
MYVFIGPLTQYYYASSTQYHAPYMATLTKIAVVPLLQTYQLYVYILLTLVCMYVYMCVYMYICMYVIKTLNLSYRFIIAIIRVYDVGILECMYCVYACFCMCLQ